MPARMPASELDKSFEEGIKEALTRLSPVGQYTALMEMLPNRDVSKDDKEGFI